ncbi:class I SAM-dependent methyltransferase [Actinokineospora sp. NBRC 105648]|uniref:class I SAM-dependent methyltransferase n=1 Tax=Actinokineospora sp. NBRC 105648 TaxID=3032206 RepID=UPI0024A1FAFF|nr:class I SAM-dependent methyltransferase [Actinokineospora sp. NBRC 105648]GLZ39797.1 cyclopropane-fatty-acyl-phospholipid synthase [Actinokineospora sp. NBRC 105648]
MTAQTADWAAFERRYRTFFRNREAVAFRVQPPTGDGRTLGSGEPSFTLVAQDAAGMAAVNSLDQVQVGLAYLDGHLDIEGDIFTALGMRKFFGDFHPIAWANRYLPAVVRGKTEHDRRSITAHYDRDPEFFLSFLDTRHRCYTQGSFKSDDEPVEDAVTRKLDLAIEQLELRPGDRVLEVGGGWGAFVEHAGRKGIEVTTLTLSEPSELYLKDLIERENLPCTVLRHHFLRYQPDRPFDAVVNMGVTEHLPDYGASLRKYQELLRPGGRVYLDALAMRAKHRVSTFMSRYIYPGVSTPLLLHDYLRQVAKSPFYLTSVDDERHNYYLTCKAWAEKLDANREHIVANWGEPLYRHFRLFLWGSAAGFHSGLVQAYRWALELPA